MAAAHQDNRHIWLAALRALRNGTCIGAPCCECDSNFKASVDGVPEPSLRSQKSHGIHPLGASFGYLRLPEKGRATSAPIAAWWLGRTSYRDAWQLQHRLVAARVAGLIGDQLLLLEHEPVLTLGRHSDPSHVLASPAELAARHIELIETERGGEVTYHGPGQLTAYPILKLADRGLMVRPLVRALEAAQAKACSTLGVEAGPKAGFPGCWCADGTRKIGAVGVRIEHGVSYHGIALNVTVRLSDFQLIDACGMPGLESTSIARELGRAAEPSIESVSEASAAFAVALAEALDAPLSGLLPPLADPGTARAGLERLLHERAPAAAAAGSR
jgi:lipoyl(octanoyl) transferase